MYAYVAHRIHTLFLSLSLSLYLSLALSRTGLLAVGQRAQGGIGTRGRAPVQG